MTNLFLTNENLKKTIQEAKISQEQKDALIAKVPELDEQERLKLLDVLKETFFIDLEKNEAIEKIKANWEE
jgi:hypothetical protein